MSDQENIKITYLIKAFEEHSKFVKEELATIKRGVYGDPENKVSGLMERQLEDERRISDLEEYNKKEQLQKKTILWVIGVMFTALQAAGIAVWEFVKSLK